MGTSTRNRNLTPLRSTCDQCHERIPRGKAAVVHPADWSLKPERLCLACLRARAMPIIEPILAAYGRSLEGLSERLVFGVYKAKEVVECRTKCWAALRTAGFSFPAIAKLFGMHHSAVLLRLKAIGHHASTPV